MLSAGAEPLDKGIDRFRLVLWKLQLLLGPFLELGIKCRGERLEGFAKMVGIHRAPLPRIDVIVSENEKRYPTTKAGLKSMISD